MRLGALECYAENMLARRLIIPFLFTIITSISVLTPKPALAQSPQPSTAPIQVTAVPVSSYTPQSPQFMNLMIFNLAHTISCLAEGVSIIGQPCIGYGVGNPNQPPQAYEFNQLPGGGMLGFIADGITLSYSGPPIRTAEYLADLGKKLNIIQPAYAQVGGSGNTVVEPIKKIWELSRNLAYLGMTAIFIIVGFMIMFRHKLNPQTVINVQNALPGLIIGLILITFSYFIASLFIDLSFVSTNLVGGIFDTSGLGKGTTQKIANGSILETFGYFIAPDKEEMVNVARETANSLGFLKKGTIGGILTILSALIGCKMGTLLGGPITELIYKVGAAGTGGAILPLIALEDKIAPVSAFFFGKSATSIGHAAGCVAGAILTPGIVMGTQLIQWVLGMILYIVLVLALLMTMFKVFFSIINAYIGIVILTLTAPIRFLLASVPGSKSSFSNWLKEMLANVLIFPAYFVVFFIASYIIGGSIAGQLGVNDPGIDFGKGTVPFLEGFSSDLIRIALGYGFLFLSPNLPDMIKGALGVKDPGYGKIAVGAVIGGFGLGKNFFNRTFDPMLKERKAYEEGIHKRKVDQAYAQPTGQNRVAPWYVRAGIR